MRSTWELCRCCPPFCLQHQNKHKQCSAKTATESCSPGSHAHMRTGILWSSPLELNILLVLSAACTSSSAIQRMSSADNCQVLGDSVCNKLYGNSVCDRRRGECQCAHNYVLISDGNDNLACNEVVSGEACERDSECRQIKKSICHPGVGLCTCPFGFQFNRSAGACITDTRPPLMISSQAETKRVELSISPGSLQHGLMVCIITSLIASSIFCCVVVVIFLIYRRCSSPYAGLGSSLHRQTGNSSNNNRVNASPALLTSLLTPCYLDLRPVEATTNSTMLFRGLEIKNDFNQDVLQKPEDEERTTRLEIATQLI